MERRGIATELGDINRAIIARNEARSVEKIAENMHELKETCFILDKKIAELRTITDEAKREMNISRVKKDEITERAEYIQTIKKQLDELRAVTTNRRQIEQIERSYERAINYFKQSYNITPEQSENEIKQLENQANSKKHLQEKLQDKLTSLIEEKDRYILEYQRQKLLAEINPDNQRIQEKLTQLDKEAYAQEQTTQGKIARTQSERTLDTMTDNNFNEILKEVKPEQAKTFIEIKERKRERERTRSFERRC